MTSIIRALIKLVPVTFILEPVSITVPVIGALRDYRLPKNDDLYNLWF